jgi:hypothetical protein
MKITKTGSRGRILALAAAAVLAVSAGTGGARATAAGQPLPDSLDAMIETALRSNPEILLAEAKIRQAQAEMNEIRLRVAQEVTKIHGMIRHHREISKRLRDRYARARELVEKGVTSDTEVSDLLIDMAGADARRSELEAEARYLLGLGGTQVEALIGGASGERAESRKPTESRPHFVAESVHGRFLDTELDDFLQGRQHGSEGTIAAVLDALGEVAGGRIAFNVDPGCFAGDAFDEPASIRLPTGATARTVLLALADRHDLAFVARDYGFLVTMPGRAREMDSPAIPEDIPVVR